MVNLWLIMVNNWNNNKSGWWFGTMEFYDFPFILGIVTPTDELHDFSEGLKPPCHQPEKTWFFKDHWRKPRSN